MCWENRHHGYRERRQECRAWSSFNAEREKKGNIKKTEESKLVQFILEPMTEHISQHFFLFLKFFLKKWENRKLKKNKIKLHLRSDSFEFRIEYFKSYNYFHWETSQQEHGCLFLLGANKKGKRIKHTEHAYAHSRGVVKVRPKRISHKRTTKTKTNTAWNLTCVHVGRDDATELSRRFRRQLRSNTNIMKLYKIYTYNIYKYINTHVYINSHTVCSDLIYICKCMYLYVHYVYILEKSMSKVV